MIQIKFREAKVLKEHVGKDDYRRPLNGYYVDSLKDGKAILISTDGTRLVKVVLNLGKGFKYSNYKELEGKILVPPTLKMKRDEFLFIFTKKKKNKEETGFQWATGKNIPDVVENLVFQEGSFPNWKQVWPDHSNAFHLVLNGNYIPKENCVIISIKDNRSAVLIEHRDSQVNHDKTVDIKSIVMPLQQHDIANESIFPDDSPAPKKLKKRKNKTKATATKKKKAKSKKK